MLQRRWSRTFFLVIFLFFVACQNGKPDWPGYILKSLWVPASAKEVKYYTLEGTYQVSYRSDVCYPATEFISQLVREMERLGWQRLPYDFRNPQLRSNYAKAPGGKWDEFIDMDEKVAHQWLENWSDSNKNILRCWLKYKGDVPNCKLQVYVIYLPIGNLP